MARPRDTSIDEAVLAAARRQLAAHGWEGLSVTAVAVEADTSRPAIYRRWTTKADLATAAVAAISDAHLRPATDDPYSDLVRELEAFRRGIDRPHGVALAATMLQEGTDRDLVRLYRDRIVTPRRRRLRETLERALGAGLLDRAADLDLAVSTLTGSFYAYAVAGRRPPRDWADRLALHTWRGLGGK